MTFEEIGNARRPVRVEWWNALSPEKRAALLAQIDECVGEGWQERLAATDAAETERNSR